MNVNNFNAHILLKGKGIKYAVLVDSENNLKVIPYSLDYLTFLFGGITYLFRKEILKGIALLFIQILSIYILDIPIGIILNFVITFIASMFSGKSYTNKLIREGALPFDEYEENGYSHEYDESIAISRASEKRGSRMLEDYKSSIKRQNTIFYCLGSLTLISIILITGFEMKLKDSSAEKTLTTKPSEEKISENIKLEIPNEFVVLLTDKGSLESFALIKYDEKNCKLSGKYYNGQVLINRDNKSIPLNEVFKSEGILPQNMFKKYFGINKKLTQIKVDINKAIIIIDFIFAPLHIIKIGPNATFGRLFIMVKKGSITLQINLLYHNKNEIAIPKIVPIIKLIIVSNKVTSICGKKFVFIKHFITSLGLDNINVFITSLFASICHINIKNIAINICVKLAIILLFFIFLIYFICSLLYIIINFF